MRFWRQRLHAVCVSPVAILFALCYYDSNFLLLSKFENQPHKLNYAPINAVQTHLYNHFLRQLWGEVTAKALTSREFY